MARFLQIKVQVLLCYGGGGTNSFGSLIKSGCRMIVEDELRRDRGTNPIGAGS